MPFRRTSFALLTAILSALACAADPPPEFSLAGVVRGAEPSPILVPGAGMSIYGSYLGPSPGCAADPDPNLRETVNPRNPDANFANLSVYPTELCGVQVLVGGKPAGLLYVSPKQINFKIPQDSAESGMLDLRVVSQGRSSASLKLPAGFETTSIALAEPAYTDSPVWLKVNTRLGLGRIAYPYLLGPAGFGCHEVEVRRDGKPLPVLPGSNWMPYGGSFAGSPCGSYVPQTGTLDRLPLHLLYRFDMPGIYEVRYTLRNRETGMPGASQIRAETPWTAIEILPPSPLHRQGLLNAARREAASAGEAELLSDLLPGILGLPDDASFDIIAGFLYHPNASVRRYAMDGLYYWPEASTSAKLLTLLHSRGPSDELVRFLVQQPNYVAAHDAEIVAASLPYLESDSAVAIDGALTAIRWPPAQGAAIFEALLRAAERIVPRADVQNRGDLVQALAASQDPRVHPLLHKFVEQGYDVAAQYLATFRDPSDLPALTALLVASPRTDRFAYLPEPLYKAYGNAAVPYFKTALEARPGRFTERNLALELMSAGDPVGFQYALRSLSVGGLNLDMIQSLKARFPELRDAGNNAVRAFLTSRAAN